MARIAMLAAAPVAAPAGLVGVTSAPRVRDRRVSTLMDLRLRGLRPR